LVSEKEVKLDGIVKAGMDKPQYGGSGFGSQGAIAVQKDPISHGIVHDGLDRPAFGGSGFAASAALDPDKEVKLDGIVKAGMDRPQYGGAGFGAAGSIAVAKDPISHGIVHDGLDRPQYGGAGFAATGSIAVEKERVSHGIIRGDAKVNDGPIDAGSDGIHAHIAQRQAASFDPAKESKARAWLESVLDEKIDEPSFQEALKSGERLCKALNRVYPNSVRNINASKTAFKQIENIGNYVKSWKILGLNKSLAFETSDLYEGRNMTIVVDNVYELATVGARKGIGAL